MLSHVIWAHKMDVGGGDGHMRGPVKKNQKNIPRAPNDAF